MKIELFLKKVRVGSVVRVRKMVAGNISPNTYWNPETQSDTTPYLLYTVKEFYTDGEGKQRAVIVDNKNRPASVLKDRLALLNEDQN